MSEREYSHGSIIIKLSRNFYRENEFDDDVKGMFWISVVSRQVFGGTGQIESWFEKPRRVETGSETTQN